jgi:hypothetical protein
MLDDQIKTAVLLGHVFKIRKWLVGDARTHPVPECARPRAQQCAGVDAVSQVPSLPVSV